MLAALTFLAPSAPTYDPWAWIIWGREILHLDLSTVDGPSWKPLPVLLTTPFALAGPLAPDLWLFVARAGAIAGVVVVFRLGRAARRRRRRRRPRRPRPTRSRRGRSATRRLGNSEGLLVALALGARRPPSRRSAAARPSRSASARRSCAPRRGRSSASTALWLLWREPGLRGLVVARLRRRCPRCGSCRSGGARATRCGRCTARRTRARTARPSPTTRRARCSSSSTRCCARPRWLGLAARSPCWPRARPLPRRPRAAEIARRRPSCARRRRCGSPSSRYMTPTTASRATSATSSCPRRSCSCSRPGSASAGCVRLALARLVGGRRPSSRSPSLAAGLASPCRAVARCAPTSTGSRYQAELTDELPGLVAARGRRGAPAGVRRHLHRAVPGPGRRVEPPRAHDAGPSSTPRPPGGRVPRPTDPARAAPARRCAASATRATCGRSRSRGGGASSASAGGRTARARSAAPLARAARRRRARFWALPRSRAAARGRPRLPRRLSRSRCARRRSTRATGSTRACRSASPRTRSSTCPAVLRQDGSPPLYYLLLHLWMGVFGVRRGATRTRCRSRSRWPRCPSAFVAGRRAVRRARRVVRRAAASRSTRS